MKTTWSTTQQRFSIDQNKILGIFFYPIQGECTNGDCGGPDGGGGGGTTNDAPVITSDGGGATAAVNAAENQTAVTTVTATDADVPADTLQYTIIGGADATRFSLDINTGVLSFNTAPDFNVPRDVGANNVYDVTVQVNDGNGGVDTQAIAVTVTNIGEPDSTPPTPPQNLNVISFLDVMTLQWNLSTDNVGVEDY